MIEDDWEQPDEFWQVLQVSGFAHNVDKASIDDLLYSPSEDPISVVDIYGDEVMIWRKHIVAIKQWTKRGGERWRKCHKEDSNEFGV